jgi:hypothetical protein
MDWNVGPRESLASRGVAAAPAATNFPISDPRWHRDLPWHLGRDDRQRAISFLGWGLLFSALLIVLPTAYLTCLVVKRRFSLRMLLLLPVVASAFLIGALIRGPQDNDFADLPARLAMSILLAPVLVFVGLMIWWLVTRQWKRCTLWLGATLIASSVAAAIALGTAGQYAPLQPEERYDWAGWYMIWFPGAYVTGWLVLITWPTRYLGLAVWKRLRAKRTTNNADEMK